MREILIKIPDEIYQSVIDGTYCGSLYKEIKNGTPLPEHHGKLIDIKCVFDAINDWIKAEEYSYTNATGRLRTRVKDIQPIIEESESR
jgi:hypothetical protein